MCLDADTKLEKCVETYENAGAELRAEGGARVALDAFVAGGCDLHRELIAVDRGSGTDDEKFERRVALEARVSRGFYDDVQFPPSSEPAPVAPPEVPEVPKSPSPQAASKPAVLKSLRVHGADRKTLQASITEKLPEVQSCFEASPEPTGKVTMQFAVDRNGVAKIAVSVAGDMTVGKCISKVIKSWMLPKPPSDAVCTAEFAPGMEPLTVDSVARGCDVRRVQGHSEYHAR